MNRTRKDSSINFAVANAHNASSNSLPLLFMKDLDLIIGRDAFDHMAGCDQVLFAVVVDSEGRA